MYLILFFDLYCNDKAGLCGLKRMSSKKKKKKTGKHLPTDLQTLMLAAKSSLIVCRVDGSLGETMGYKTA